MTRDADAPEQKDMEDHADNRRNLSAWALSHRTPESLRSGSWAKRKTRRSPSRSS
jgi:hypothetical protein